MARCASTDPRLFRRLTPRDLQVQIAAERVARGQARTVRLASYVGAHPRTVRRALARLRALGLVVECARGRPWRTEYADSRRGVRRQRGMETPLPAPIFKADKTVRTKVSAFPPRYSLPPSDLGSLIPPSFLLPLCNELGAEARITAAALRALFSGFPTLASLASAGDALRRLRKRGLTMEETLAYCRAAPRLPGIFVRTDAPWLAATSRDRVAKWKTDRERVRAREALAQAGVSERAPIARVSRGRIGPAAAAAARVARGKS